MVSIIPISYSTDGSLTEDIEFCQVYLSKTIKEEIILPIASPVSYTVFATRILPDSIGIIFSSVDPHLTGSAQGQVFPSSGENEEYQYRNLETNRNNYCIKCFENTPKFLCICTATLGCMFFIYTLCPHSPMCANKISICL